ncbi:MAG TPA: lipocalin family protein [Adhaeribacter sp.]|nr:lipocalin family protein [Adhaeribacter sp.]
MMKNYQFTFLVLLSASLFIFTGCDNDDDDVQAKTRTELLTVNPWRLTTFTVEPGRDINGDGVPDTNLFAFLPPCTQDDLTVFRTNNTYTEEEGPTKCDASHPDVIVNGTWAFSADESRLTMDPSNDDPLTVNIVELSATTLRTTSTFTDSATTYTYTSVYVH